MKNVSYLYRDFKSPQMDIKHKTLSFQSAEVIRHFNDLNKPAFKFKEVEQLLQNSSNDSIKKLMRDMVKRGLLLRLKDGVYWIIPYDQESASYFPNWHEAAKYLVNGSDYYIGYYSALEIHSLITQPSLKEQIVVNKQIKPSELKIRGYKFQFIYNNSHHFFGSKEIWINSFNKIPCSDLEKTFVDCLYKPDYAGGITEIAKAIFKSKKNIDFEKLLDYCEKFGAQSVIKRLGLLLEVLDINDPMIKKLYKLKTKSSVLLEPSYEKKGKMNTKWSVQQNVETNDILSPIFT
jgi:predicted transcriptional regulator of viral defense system